MGRTTTTKANKSWRDKPGYKGVLKKLNPFKGNKKFHPRSPKLQAFKNVRPTPVKKTKKSTGITATSTPKLSKVVSKIAAEATQDFVPLEASPSPAIRRSGRKKSPVERLNTPKTKSSPASKPPPTPATIVARDERAFRERNNVQKLPIVIDITQTEDESTPGKNNDVVLLGARKSIAKKKASAKKNKTKELGEITISDGEEDKGSAPTSSRRSSGEIEILGEKKPLRRFPSVLNRQTPAKGSKQGFADYVRDNHRRDRRNQPYPAMGTKASSRSRLRTGATSSQDLQRLQQLPIFQSNQQQPPNQQWAPQTCLQPGNNLQQSPAPSFNPNNVIQAVQEPLFKTGLRPIVIDGSNVAVQHSIAVGRGTRFSSQGIKICVEFFQNRGHEVTVFVPQYRTKSGMADDRHLLDRLYQAGTLAFTPSASYDDRYVLQYAQTCGGIVVSNDQYNDIKNESPELYYIATKKKLGFTWAKNTLMFPQDPMGRDGPTLDKFLSF